MYFLQNFFLKIKKKMEDTKSVQTFKQVVNTLFEVISNHKQTIEELEVKNDSLTSSLRTLNEKLKQQTQTVKTLNVTEQINDELKSHIEKKDNQLNQWKIKYDELNKLFEEEKIKHEQELSELQLKSSKYEMKLKNDYDQNVRNTQSIQTKLTEISKLYNDCLQSKTESTHTTLLSPFRMGEGESDSITEVEKENILFLFNQYTEQFSVPDTVNKVMSDIKLSVPLKNEVNE